MQGRQPRVRRLERWAAAASFAAGAIHVMAGPAHFEEWWAYGVFFYAAAAAQVSFAILLLTQGIQGWGGWTAVRSKVYVAGIVGNAAIIVLWAVTRTVGVPAGPEAGEVEGVGALDAASKVLEVLLIALLVRLRSAAVPPAGVPASAR